MAHTLSNNPGHVGDIDDQTGEADPRPWGDGAVPASLDIDEVWIDASSADELVLHVKLDGIPIIPETAGWRYYAVWMDIDAQVCSGGSEPVFIATISPVGPNFPGHSWWWGCFDRSPDGTTGYLEQAWPLPEGQWMGGSSDEVQIRVPRELKQFDTLVAGIPQGAEVTDFGAASWTWSTPVAENYVQPRALSPFVGMSFYGPFPFADTTPVNAGPITV